MKRGRAFLIMRAHSIVWWIPFLGSIVCVSVAVIEMIRMDDQSVRIIGVLSNAPGIGHTKSLSPVRET